MVHRQAALRKTGWIQCAHVPHCPQADAPSLSFEVLWEGLSREALFDYLPTGVLAPARLDVAMSADSGGAAATIDFQRQLCAVTQVWAAHTQCRISSPSDVFVADAERRECCTSQPMWMERTDPALGHGGGPGVKANTIRGVKPPPCALGLFDLEGKRVADDGQLRPIGTSPRLLLAIESVGLHRLPLAAVSFHRPLRRCC